MTVETRTIQFHTRGNAEMTDITDQVREEIQKSAISNGTVTIFCPSSTTA
ncbi:MAG: YjbQ family protein, partial [candidate division Zixibacteria bacterium]|nr:YjbQ family protein [candidate division Zixibacteria bacterium]NIW44953.1 YjbQ family protein [Gammaproteobacteria bacterium]NIR64113.1 YjbQ family protein [candidate division Zixibacteria bacterium]NIS46013.1 YjbQ family protein [candidate division Zixibacteria bacterium]NIU14136.1 YjbQ family protein [candidate division Zixibacteria bacterium]